MHQVHQLVHTVSYGDAISGEVMALQRCFRALGMESEIYAINTDPRYKEHVRNFKELGDGFTGTVILHYSLGSPLNQLYRSLNRASRWMIYHNLTPAKWFRRVNSRIASDIEAGIKELPDLLLMSDRVLADSQFNARELASFGCRASVLELPVDPERWNVPANHGIASLVRSEPGQHILHVGRLAPNKCIEDIIKAFHFFHQYLEPRSRLWLVGIDIDTELYSYSLKRLAVQLQVEQAVNFVGCLADSEVKALYENASLYVCMSEHEGFCLPVAEAMHFGVPVLAYSSSALPETVGRGGVLVDRKDHPFLAELMLEMCRNENLRASLIAAGRERVSELSFERFSSHVQQLFEGRGV